MAQGLHLGFLSAPPLWINEQFGIQQFAFPKVDLSDFTPEPIPKNIRLGHQMEYVFKQLISHDGSYEIVLHNLPIKKEGRTIGEIDFILREVGTQKLIHVELTYKFYIVNPEISEPIHRLMGPDKRDMFFTKMEKIKNRQFFLLHTLEGTKALMDKGLDVNHISHQACYKARLFIPYGSKKINIRPLNTECTAGCWLRFRDFNTRKFQPYTYYFPFKWQWAITPYDDVAWLSHQNALMETNLRMLRQSSPMLWMKKPNGKIDSLFVTWW
ncbi:MAG: DUF1853 family protein [Bacteroidota bacterium]